jgi:transcriptional regulator with XRE-family HTH domain
MKAAKILRQARARAGLSQRDLSALTGIPQPMISAIERGLQDPRHATLDKLLHACGQELDLVLKGGEGVDPTQFIPSLGVALRARLKAAAEGSKNVEHMRRSIKWVTR